MGMTLPLMMMITTLLTPLLNMISMTMSMIGRTLFMSMIMSMWIAVLELQNFSFEIFNG